MGGEPTIVIRFVRESFAEWDRGCGCGVWRRDPSRRVATELLRVGVLAPLGDS